MTEAHTNALQTIIGEFKNLSPEIIDSFIFKKNGEISAIADPAFEEPNKKLIASFNSLNNYSEAIGGIENLAIQSEDKQLNITAFNSHYLVTISSQAADQRITKFLTTVIIPTVIGLMDQIAPDAEKQVLPRTAEPEAEPIKEVPLQEEATFQESVAEVPVQFSSDPLLPEAPVTQFMVEKVGGLLVPSDTVRVDSDVIAKWRELYGDRTITEVHIETLDGKTTTCKFKPLKEADSNAKGIIQFPEKIMQKLQTSKGKLVMVKPVIQGIGE